MSTAPPFGWIEPSDVDRGLSFARVTAGEVFAARGSGVVVREAVRQQITSRFRDLTAEEVDGALEWALRRLAYLLERQTQQEAPLRAFEARVRAVLESVPASRCSEARRRLLAEDHELPPAEALAVLARVAPSCQECLEQPRETVPEPLSRSRLGW